MANDWIKMRINLPDDPAVIGIASRTKLAPLDVVARLYLLWCWADEQADDGFLPNVTPAFLDAKVKRAGFAEAMASKGVEWLIIEADGIRFPNFDRHNGESAKKRATHTEKKRRQREILSPKKGDSVPENSGQNRDNCGTREEKSREEKIVIPCAPPAPRPRDLVFDAVVEVTGQNPAMSGGEIGKALKAIRTVTPDVTPDEIRRRAANYKSQMPDTTMSASALAKWWTKCDGAGLLPSAGTLESRFDKF
jgi:hypothetical protein